MCVPNSRNSYYCYGIQNYQISTSTSINRQIVAIYVIAKLWGTFGVPICFSLRGKSCLIHQCTHVIIVIIL